MKTMKTMKTQQTHNPSSKLYKVITESMMPIKIGYLYETTPDGDVVHVISPSDDRAYPFKIEFVKSDKRGPSKSFSWDPAAALSVKLIGPKEDHPEYFL